MQPNDTTAIDGGAVNDEATSSLAPDFDAQTEAAQGEFVGRSKPKLPQATIAMGLLFAAGIAIVVALSTGGGPEEATASDAAVEAQVESFIVHSREKNSATEAGADGAALVDRFYNFASRRQVPMDKLNTNPFSRVPDNFVSTNTTTPKPVIRIANQKRRGELQREFGGLKLQGIMVTNRGGTAIINGDFATIGRKVGSFTVTNITPDDVELTCDEMTFKLQLRR